MAQAQKRAKEDKTGKRVAFLDVEQAMSLKYANALGINTEELIFSQPTSGEETMDMVEILCNSGAVDVIVIDSVAAMQTQAELDGEIGDAHIGQLARLMSQGLRKIITAANKSGTIVIFINQIRDKIGVMGYGEKTTTTGGNALKFYCSVRIDVRKISSIKKGDEVIGNKVKVKIAKNKVAPPHMEREVEIYFGKGISQESEVLDFGVDVGVIDKSGAWYSYGDMKLGNGRPAVLNKLSEETELYEQLKTEVLEAVEAKKQEKIQKELDKKAKKEASKGD
jgi:recombination protein RecA